jgi:peptidoglycan/LPS O-acetylase OafA/YrhL
LSVLDHRQHLKSLDGLRGFAFLMVFFCHIYPLCNQDPFSHLRSIGWLGVDLFFVLSGFLITGILYDTLHQPHYFRNFYARRGLRLFPVYVVVVAIVIAINYSVGGHLTLWAIPFFFYGSNIVRDAGKDIGMIGFIDVSHFWSLAVEEQFYFFWPFVLFFVRSRRAILWICALGSLFAIILRLVAVEHDHFFLGTPYFELPMRLDSLLSGGALAMLMRSARGIRFLTPARLHVGIVVGGLTLLFCIFSVRSISSGAIPMVRYGYFGASLLFASVVALTLQTGSWAYRAGSLSVLRTFGRYSYGLYLIHFLANAEVQRLYLWSHQCNVGGVSSAPVLTHVAAILFCLGYLALLLGIAMVSYHTLELPLLRMKRYFAYTDEKKAHHMQPDQDTVVTFEAS